jgi:short-subunit dehydrogenase
MRERSSPDGRDGLLGSGRSEKAWTAKRSRPDKADNGGTVLGSEVLGGQNPNPKANPMTSSNKLAVITGASTGIGLELAKLAARDGYDLIIAADEAEIETAGVMLRAYTGNVEVVETDLATLEGVDRLYAAINRRKVDVLAANAGRGLGHAFLDQHFEDAMHVVNTNITGTIYLIQKIGRDMRAMGDGKILITGSIAGFIPGTYQAVYNATKAFIDSFSHALRAELRDTGVSVTCLMPGATETEFFRRAGLMDTKVGVAEKDDPADVAEAGWKALTNGEGDVVSGWKNKIQSAMANVTPAPMLAEQHRKMAEPGSARK